MSYKFFCSKCELWYSGGYDSVHCSSCGSYCGHMRTSSNESDSPENSISKGRGLWVIILWTTWIFITLSIGVFIAMLLEENFSIERPISFLGFLVGFMFAMSWYNWDFTRRHPFFSSIFGWIFWFSTIFFLSNKFLP